MNELSRTGGRRGAYSIAAATVVLLVVGIISIALGIRGYDGPPVPPIPAAAAAAAQPVTASVDASKQSPSRRQSSTATTRFGAFLPASMPTGIDIPSIGVHSTSFVALGVAADGTIEVPGTADEVGLYAGGPTPGQLGPSVMAAHVDSTKGPGIFYRLGEIVPGDKVRVTRADGSRLTFVVDKVAQYPKDKFPTDLVYHGDFTTAQIRLVTCGGTFDKVKHYLDNVVVFGHLDSPS